MKGFSEFEAYDALGLAELVRLKKVSPAELLEAAIARVEARNGAVNAVTMPLYDLARAAIADGLPSGPFTGVPFLMKDLTANSFGLESAGVWQVRGNGGLVLTEKALHFFMFLPQRDLRVPLDAITELTLTKSHLGKATIYDLLKVRFSAEDKTDSIAWYLTDPQAWKDRIEELKAGRRDQW